MRPRLGFIADAQWDQRYHRALEFLKDLLSPPAPIEVTLIPASHALPASAPLEALVETARDYARASKSDNTQRAYAADWAAFAGWCKDRHANPMTSPERLMGLYIADCASGTHAETLSVSTIERRLSGLVWAYRAKGTEVNRRDPHIATVMAGIKRQHGKPPRQKAALSADDILAMAATLPHNLRGLRDRSILLLGFAGGLRRSEIVSLDVGREDTVEQGGWVEIEDRGAVAILKGKTGWREVEIGRGTAEVSCPVHALEQWLHYGRIDFGPIYRRTTRDNLKTLDDRLSDRHVARLIKATIIDARLFTDIDPLERIAMFSGHSLRAGLATHAQADERFVQKQLGHASAEMTRRYQRDRDRFRVNLTKAAGL